MQAHQGVYISVQPETQQQAQELTTLLEHAHCTWHIDEDGTFTIYPVNPIFAPDLLATIQAM